MLAVGAQVDRYVVEGFLGEGGAAAVWRVRHQALGTTHALKVLRVPSPGTVARLLREGRVMGAVDHPNLLAVHDLIEVDGVPALLVEYAAGPSLAAVLDRGRLPPLEAERVAGHVLAGLAAAHAAGLVHRDVKPGNVLLDLAADGYTAKLSDFGLAKVLDDAAPAHVTRTGATLGTPAYMAPEQFGGAGDVDARADVFAAGVLLYELVTGRLPYPDATPAARLRRSLDGDFADPAGLVELSPRRAEALRAALSPAPEARPRDGAELAAAWAPAEVEPPSPAFLEGLRALTPQVEPTATWNATIPTESVADAPAPTPAVPPRRSWGWPAAAGVGVAAVAVVAAAGWWAGPGDEPAAGLERLDDGGRRSVWSAAGVTAWSDGRDVWVRRGDAPPDNLTASVEVAVDDVALARGGGRVVWSEGGTIVSWTPATGERRELFRGGWDPAVSPDGRWIAYVNQDIPDPFERAGFEARLGLLDAETGSARLLLLDLDATDPTFSPDGDQIAFMGGREGLATVRTNGRGLRVLEAVGYTPLWDRPERLLSSEPTPDGGSRLMSLSLTEASERVPVGEVPAGHVRSLTLVGDEVRATVVVEHAGVERVDVGPGGVAGARRWLAPPDGWFTAPSVGDDGRVAAATFRPSETVVILGGAAPEVWADGFVYARGPRWLPTGDLLFYGVERSGLTLVHRAGHAGVHPLSAALGESVFMAVPTRDGDRVATTAEHGTRLLVFDLARPWDDQLDQKRTAPAGWLPVDYGPDGALLVTDGVDRLGVWRGDEVEVLRAGSAWGVWSEDGARVLFAEGSTLSWLEVATGLVTPFVGVEGRLPLGEGFDLAPDDSFVVVTARTAEASSWRLR